MKKALIVWGGWDGHEPDLIAKRFQVLLEKNNFEVKVTDDMDTFCDGDYLKSLDLIIPIITMAKSLMNS